MPFPQQGSQVPSSPPWIPDFSQMSSTSSYEPPLQESSESPDGTAPREDAIADDPQPEAPQIVLEPSQPVDPEADADHPVS
jgi:hypothetical protein